MKKKLLFAATAMIAAAMCLPVACKGGEDGGKNTGVAYGLVNGGMYVGKASVTMKGNDVTACTLEEVCFPTNADHAQAGEDVGESDKTGTFYNTFKLDTLIFNYNEDAEDYETGETTFTEWIAIEANMKTYFEAVVSDQIKVVVGGEDRTDILCNATLNKDLNGYWSAETDTLYGSDLGWKGNRDATVKFVLDHGVSDLLNLVQNDDNVWVYGDLSTGATWSNLNNDPTGYVSYAQLITNAAEAAKDKQEIGGDTNGDEENKDQPSGGEDNNEDDEQEKNEEEGGESNGEEGDGDSESENPNA